MRRGLTLIEIIVTIAIIAILVGVYFLVANPGAQLASARNTRRKTDLENIMLAIRQNIADQGNGQFGCATGAIPATATDMGSGAGAYNIAPCLIPTYLSAMPFDPNATSVYYTSASDYNTGYAIMRNASDSVTLTAPYAELGQTISLTQ